MTEQEIRDYCFGNKERILKAVKSQIRKYPIPDGAWVSNLADRIVEPYNEKKFYKYDCLKRMICQIFPTKEDAETYLEMQIMIEDAVNERMLDSFSNSIDNFVSVKDLAIGDKR